LTARVRAWVEGQVQGVGFRPAVYRQAVAHGLTGFVRNDLRGVTLDVEGEESAIADFFCHLTEEPPARACITRLTRRTLPLRGYDSFRVSTSKVAGDLRVHLPPDTATCAPCLREMKDPADRRHNYPFTNCVECGPRFTIVWDLPYDRARTSMAEFVLCPDCAAEYRDPSNRRFHAEPNACPRCGPHLFLLERDRGSTAAGAEALRKAQEIILTGGIVAVKGLGGYHLACDAFAPEAVARLRLAKSRPDKAFAVMFKDMAALLERFSPTEAETAELLSSVRPIVVLPGRLNDAISPDTATTGVFLPYTPLHHLLLEPFEAIVLTSGNRRDEPLAHDEEEALALLNVVADAALAHNRPIAHRCDDSVVQMVDGRRSVLRRARGFVPMPIPIAPYSEAVLATGGDLKNTFCLVSNGEAFLSQHIGDLHDHATYTHYRDEIDRWRGLLRVEPQLVAHDLHPAYMSTRFAMNLGGTPRTGVQHHHAHVVGVMAEHALHDPVLGVALDGSGFGPDHTVWGGEIMLADRVGFERVARFKTYPMPGGEMAIREPWRMALSVARSEGVDWRPAGIPAEQALAIEELLESKLNCPATSSAGRLFDAAAAYLGLCLTADYEAQGAIRLEAAADATVADHYPYRLVLEPLPAVLDFGPCFHAFLREATAGSSTGAMAGRFHNTVAAAVTEICAWAAEVRGVQDVALSGGVFQNRLLLARLGRQLRDAGLRVFANHLVPANDGGLALGQAAVAVARAQRGVIPCA
jgi:hydrogenase maturation protein HypF